MLNVDGADRLVAILQKRVDGILAGLARPGQVVSPGIDGLGQPRQRIVADT